MEVVNPTAQGMAGTMRILSWGDCYQAASQMWDRYKHNPPEYIYGVPRGGCHAALLFQSLAHRDGKSVIVLDEPVPGTLIVDDIVDSGKTLQWFIDRDHHRVDALYRSERAPLYIAPCAWEMSEWVTFPWEIKEGTGAEDIVIRLLQFMGEDVTRDGLKDTPRRVLKAWKELTAGYQADVRQILSTSFEQPHDELVMLRDIEFHSTCEHHLLPFYGTATVGYIPTDKVVGISKLARLVDCFARRLQIQERMCSQIAQSIQDILKPLGVGVILQAKHSCMGCRGVMKPDASMVTSMMLGKLRTDAQARNEFLQLTKV